MQRKRKRFNWPRKLYDKQRITDENALVTEYGLKNKREIWKLEAKVRYFRTRAKSLITAPQEEQAHLFRKLNQLGLNVHSIADILALTKENLLKRRLTHLVVQKGFATTPKQARQMIVHRRVHIHGKVVNSPGYLVPVSEEQLITVIATNVPVQSKPVEEEITNE